MGVKFAKANAKVCYSHTDNTAIARPMLLQTLSSGDCVARLPPVVTCHLQIALIRLYQQFALKLTPGQLPLAVHTNLTMAPTHGVKVLVQRRV